MHIYDDDPPFTLPYAWELFRDSLHWLANIFGTPRQLRAQFTQPKKDHTILISWLRSLEALVSRLLLIAAKEIILDDTPTPHRARTGKRNPLLWRVRLNLHGLARPQRKPSAPCMRGEKIERLDFDCAGPAARFMALCRVADHPVFYAKRLARRLKREPDLPRRVARAPIQKFDPFAPHAQGATEFLFEAFPEARGDTS